MREIQDQLQAGWEPDLLMMEVDLPPASVPEGHMWWRERWFFPSEDLLMARDSLGVYAPGSPSYPPHGPDRFGVELQISLVAGSDRLILSIPFRAFAQPWLQERAIAPGLRRRQFIKTIVKGQLAPKPLNGQPWPWTIFLVEGTSEGEILTNLVIMALKQGFFVSEDEAYAARVWVKGIVRDEDLASEVIEALWKHFELPPSEYSLRGFVWQTARWVASEQRRQAGKPARPKAQDTAESGELPATVYPASWVAQEMGVSERTVYRWMEGHGFVTACDGTRALSADQLAVYRQEQTAKASRQRPAKAIRQRLRDKGFSAQAAWKRFQRWEQDGLSLEEMAREALEVRPRRDGKK
jgi:hypothetical protein